MKVAIISQHRKCNIRRWVFSLPVKSRKMRGGKLKPSLAGFSLYRAMFRNRNIEPKTEDKVAFDFLVDLLERYELHIPCVQGKITYLLSD